MFKLVKKIIIVLTFLVGIFAATGFVLAATPDLGLGFGASLGLSSADPRVIIANIIRIALGFLGILAVGLIVYAGFLWMTAAGNEERIDQAKKVLISAVIGLIIILSAFAIATFILNSILAATGNGSGENGPCSSSATSCVPSSALCQTGLTCGNDCFCHTNGVFPPVEPGGSCGDIAFGYCTVTGNCTTGYSCDTTSTADPEKFCTCQPDNGVGRACNATTTPGVCINNGSCSGNNFCDTTNPVPEKFCTCQPRVQDGRSCDASPDPGCQQSNVCQNGSFCDPDNVDYPCTCQPGSGIGQSCDADPATPACEADQNFCSNDLVCDTTNPDSLKVCTCQDNPVINYVSPSGGLCANDNTKECRVDTDCSGSTCSLNTPSAAIGNIISIGGRYFGAVKGAVLFSDGTSPTVAGQDPSTVNSFCISSWNDTQIIIVVPANAKTGAIRVRRTDGKIDDTNDSRGSMINDLQVNGIVKPGLCSTTPRNGRLGDTVGYYGVNFSGGAAVANFGNYGGSIAGRNSSFDPKIGSADVPNISSGQTTTYVANSGGQNSNYLQFTKTAEPNTGPYIIDFKPVSGAPGQYVTIRGSGFGAVQGTSDVYFGSPNSGYKANYQFPDICADSVWSDKQIIVKVPAGIPVDGYVLHLDIGGRDVSATGLFTVNNNPLVPSLCKISPVMGQVGTTVNLWGEYFGNFDASSKIKFYSDINVDGKSGSWGMDTESTGAIRPDKAEADVPLNAATGPVTVVNSVSSDGGNGLNFQVGSCLQAPDQNSACGGQKCCPAGTQKAGSCVGDIATDCQTPIKTSVYEFDFNTGTGIVPPGSIFGSCQEKSEVTGTCNNDICPNSPGACSLFSQNNNVLQDVGICTDAVCDSKPVCANSACTYDARPAVNRCVVNPPLVCGLASSTKNILGQDVPTYCAAVKDSVSQAVKNKYIFDRIGPSCPLGWDAGLYNLRPVCIGNRSGSNCVPCASGFDCINPGVCAAPGNVCPDGSACDSGVCKKAAKASCSCCCRKDPQYVKTDCCGDLECTGTCGANTDPNGGDFGSCGGCKTAGGTQADWNAKCNCSGTTGKVCDANDPNFLTGVCRDCASLSSPESCSANSDTCCVDGTKNDNCVNRAFGAKTTDVFELIVSNGLSYCRYNTCNSQTNGCEATTTDKTAFASSTECSAKCKAPAQLGASCQALNQVSACNLNICSGPFACMLDDGSTPSGGAPAPSTGCGFCCCNPNDVSNGACASLGTPDKPLRCKKDQTPCAGDNRGLCCGCSANTDCVASGQTPETQGCGADTCCHARPAVASTLPVDGATGVCTNAVITATFSQMMNVSSFSGNVLAVGEYIGKCPAGTVYLAAAGKGWEDKKILARLADQIYNNIKKPLAWILGKDTLADSPDPSNNYCAVPGSVSGVQAGGSQTVLSFTPKALLAAGMKYFVIMKGDGAGLNNSQNSVRSLWEVGMNAQNSPTPDNSAFNGITYPGAYIWSFSTLPDTTTNPQGKCLIDRAVISPSSYLFQTTDNDKNESDTDSSNKTFDTVADSDKVFVGRAVSKDGQVLHPVSGYDWNWSGMIDNNNIADTVSGVIFPASSYGEFPQLIRAKTGVTDNRTKLTATINMTPPAATPANNSATANIFVFVCRNPWPPVDQSTNTWRPWQDSPDASVCLTNPANCGPMNYELYYCRDQGNGGPNIDLPTITSGLTQGGTADILKESFFFRDTPLVASSLTVSVALNSGGGAVGLSWTPVSGASSYNVYYGTSPGQYGTAQNVASLSYTISGLQNGKTYYAAVTAVNANNTESSYSSEVNFTPTDSAPPQRVSDLILAAARARIILPINLSFDQTASSAVISLEAPSSQSIARILREISNFQAYYGYGTSQNNRILPSISVSADDMLNKGKAIVLPNLATGTPYYVILRALNVNSTPGDEHIASSSAQVKFVLSDDKAPEVSFVGPNSGGDWYLALNLLSDAINVFWTANTDNDTVGYKLYYGANSSPYDLTKYAQVKPISGMKSSSASFPIDNIKGTYYVDITAVDKYGNEGQPPGEQSIAPFAPLGN